MECGFATVVVALGLVLVALAWPRHEPEPEPKPDPIEVLMGELERQLRLGRDFQCDRAVVQREMPGLWLVWLDGFVCDQTAQSPAQARQMVETHLRLVQHPPRRGGYAVGRPRRSRVERARADWRRDTVY